MGQRQSSRREAYMREIDFIFYHEAEIREAVQQARLSSSRAGLVCVSSNSSNISDPTALRAVRNLTRLKSVVIKSGVLIEHPEQWLEVIDKTYIYCAKQKDCRLEVAKRRYSGEDYQKTLRDLHLSNSTFRRLLELVKIYAALQAVQLGLIKV